jgi:8-amino-7-oxononanoate synthase
MDGDVADVEKLIFLARKYDALLFLDEAHATGVQGKNGYGGSTNFDLDYSSTIVMGTFSKALASSGAYVACSKKIKEYLIQVSKEFIYSTALSPFCIGVAKYNWDLLKTDEMKNVRKRIIEFANKLRQEIKKPEAETNIIPITCNSIEEMLHIGDIFFKNKIIVSSVRPPTCPTPRIRLAANASHEEKDLESVLKVLKK